MAYAEFNNEYKMHQNMQRLTEMLANSVDPAGQPLYQNQQGTPLHTFIRQLNLEPAVQAPAYDFELQNNVTLNEIKAQCTIRNLSIFDITRVLGNRAFYDTTFGAPVPAGQPPNNDAYQEYSRPESAEKAAEMNLVTFYGDSHTVVHWAETMPKLKEMFQARIYTNAMAKTALMNMVHKYQPEQAILLATQTANEIATYLLQLDSNRDKRQYHRQQLFKVTRSPLDDLPAALAKAQLLINQIYPQNDPAYAAHRSSTFRTALISFCHDTVAAGVVEKIQHHQTECLPLTDEELRDFAIRFENSKHLRPTSSLAFGRSIGNTPAAAYIQLNSMRVNALYPAYPPTHPNPYANPYPAYPPMEQMMQMQNQPIGPNPMQQQLFNQNQQLNAGPNMPADNPLQPQQNAVENPFAQMQNAAQLLGAHNANLADFLLQHQPNQALPDPMLPHMAQPAAFVPNLQFQNYQQQFRPAQMQNRPQVPAQRQLAPAFALNQPGLSPGYPVTPRNPVIPDQNWLASLPPIARDLRSPLEEFRTPENSNSPPTPPWAGAGALAVPNLPYIPTPKKTMLFDELPTNTSVFVQNRRRLATVDGEVVLVENHPEDVNADDLLEQIQALQLEHQPELTGAKKKLPKGSYLETRKSSRVTKPIDRYQAGTNCTIPVAVLNAILPTRGYVDQSGRYRSYSRDKSDSKQPANTQSSENTHSRPSSAQSSSSRPNSRNDSRSRIQWPLRDNNKSRDRSQSPFDRNQPKSLNQNADNRLSRNPYKSTFRSSDRSSSTRRTYPQMQKGINCRSDYNPTTTKNCTKCMKNGHHEFECARYFLYNSEPCSFCNKMNHKPQDCKEIKEFPPGINQKN